MDSPALDLKLVRHRPAQRRNPWNLLLIPFAILGIGVTWYGIVELFVTLRSKFFPADAFLADGTRFGNNLLHVVPFFTSLGVGLLFANLCVWTIPPARQALDGEAANTNRPGFQSSNQALTKFTLVVSLITFPLAALGATSYFYLTPSGIAYRSSIFSPERHYSWSDVAAVETACWYNRGPQESYALRTFDSTRIGILESRNNFLQAYPSLTSALTGHQYIFNHDGVTYRCYLSLSPRWRRILTMPPTSHSTAMDH